MHLAALYVDDHFLFDVPQLINFGSKYYYFIENGDTISRKINEKFIDNFYASDTIQLVSAIVGKNGTGKTSILKGIIEAVRRENSSFSHIRIYEDGLKTKAEYYVGKKIINLKFEANDDFNTNTQTIYYSPFLDFQEPNHGIDLSYDAILEKDLNSIFEITQEGITVIPSRKLKIKNWYRQIEFQNSQFGQDLRTFFDFPSNGQSRISFNTYKLDLYVDSLLKFDAHSNTPRKFQNILENIYAKIEREKQEVRENKSHLTQVNVQKELFKLNILMNVLCLLISQMEKHNTVLEEGFIEGGEDQFLENSNGKNALDSFFQFLDLHFYSMNPGGGKHKILPVDETKDLITRLYQVISDLEAVDDRDHSFFNWSEKAFYLDEESTKEFLELQVNFLSKVDLYYGTIKNKEGSDYFEGNRVEELMNFEPSNRKLSSGENALLNFYSRIYNYFKKNLFEVPFFKDLPKNYLLLLDEADLGFHPMWKKKYVKSCLSFLLRFFQYLKVDIQVVFTTHDPLTISDIPNYNIIYLNYESGKSSVLNELEKPQKSFGANITDLLADSFFISDGLIGDFANDKIQELIKWLSNIEDKENGQYYKQLISIIDERVVQSKLIEMYDEKMQTSLQRAFIENQIKELEDKLKKL